MFTIDKATKDAAGVFLVGELERLDQTLNLPLVSYKWSRDMPLRSDVSIADEISSFTNTDFAAAGGVNPNGKNWIGKNSTAIPGVNLMIERTAQPLELWGMELGWTLPELASAMRAGRPVDAQKYDGMQMKWNMDVDEQVYIGDADKGMPGMLNLPSITPVAAAAAWTATTDPDVIVQDINLVLSSAWVSSGYAMCPRKIGLAPELFGLLASKKVSSAGNISVLEYVKINTIAFQENGEPLEIVSMKWASGRGAGGAHRIVAYTQEEKYIRFPLVPLLSTPLEYRGIYQLTTYYGRLGQVETPYANTIAYLDVPAS
ncbi:MULTISPECIES: DUF2184 domain-containing protein [Klebsiella]|jgi:hypothetical protein|uniref:DUF2184 domain-containing protein n=1 Tax=Klebsiella TaxID=570 RepID=UPI000668C7AB|nr:MULTISPECIES: DUF2184 domain-containing protein [Klebsiella]EGT0068281.1 DUF2184 domain-containing protein [Klebsiella michiganensis]VTM71686.1 Uncharacterized protein conserved in bacteria [Raoultella planticola]HCT2143222.1 DUF2184 domain-containing protein [Raoultella ornithinolytica]EKQ7273611.1 DUF2184 domain-containing protein [Klebsiella pneumoniae]EKZ6414263.1 DUF2184 domain-containing protein [Klebsiella pneumoniae]